MVEPSSVKVGVSSQPARAALSTQQAIDSFLSNRRARGLRANSLQWYKARLKEFAKLHVLIPERADAIEKFLSRPGISQQARSADFRALRTFYRFINDRFDVPYPLDSITAPRQPKKVMPTLEPGQLALLLESATMPRDEALLTLLIDTGVRASELADLKWTDISRFTILVEGKTGQREVPISPETERLLLSLPHMGPHVFYGQRGKLTRTGVYRIVQKTMVWAGISGPKLGPHRLRHSFGKSYLVAGGDLRSLQSIMGHANISTTEKYASLNLNDIIIKHKKFSPLRLIQGAHLRGCQRPHGWAQTAQKSDHERIFLPHKTSFRGRLPQRRA